MADEPLNTEVAGDPESCRTTATWLAGLADGVGDLGAAFGRTGSQSESFWHGAAGDAFRGAMANAKGNAGRAEQVTSAAAQALSRFADELDTVTGRMSQARQVAARAGLTVTDTEIQPPGAGPGVALAMQVAAFNEVTGTVSEARGKERAAHDALRSAMKQHNETLDSLRTYGAQALSTSVSLVSGLAGASEKLLRSSERSMQLAVFATALQAGADLPPGARQYLRSAQEELFEKYYKDGLDRAGIERIIGKMPPNVRELLVFNASDMIRKITGTTRDIPVLKRLPLVGTGITAIVAGTDVMAGKDAVKSTENAVGGTAAAMGVSAGIESAVIAAEVAGLAVPGPGWVVTGSLVLGTAAALGVGYVVEHYGDQFNQAVGNAASDIGHAVSDAATGTGRVVGDLF